MAFLDALLGDIKEAPDSARKIFGFLMHGAQGLSGTAPNSGTGTPQTGSFPIATPPFVAKQPQPQVKTGTFPSANAPPAAPPATPAAPAPVPSPMSPTAAPAATTPAPGPAAMEPVTLGPGAAPAVPNAPLQPVDLGPAPQPSIPQRPTQKVDLTGRQKLNTVGLGVLSGIDDARKYYDQKRNAPAYAYDEEVERGRKSVANEQLVEKNSAETERDLAQAENQRSEAEARRNPPAKTKPDPKTVDTGEGVFQYNEASGRYDIRVADSKTKAGPEEKFMGVPVKDIQAEITANPQTYPNGDIYSNRKKAALNLGASEAASKREPPHALVAEPQPDGSSKIVEVKSGSTLKKGAQTVSEFGKSATPTADEQRRADLAENMNENLNQLEEIVKRSPNLFGPAAGRLTSLRGTIGTGNEDIAALETLKHQLGMAQLGAHSMRSAQGVEKAAESILNGFNNTPEAILASIAAARNSLKTFHDDVTRKGGDAGPAKSYTDAEVQAAVAAHPGTTAKQIEDAYKAKGYTKK